MREHVIVGECRKCKGNIHLEVISYDFLVGSYTWGRSWCDGKCRYEQDVSDGDVLGVSI